jgi:hypothetical protein
METNLVSGQFISGYFPVMTNFCFPTQLSNTRIQIMIMNSWIIRDFCTLQH